MKNTQLMCKREKIILQVFHNHYTYTKNQKSFSERKSITDWKTEINSTSGYFENDKLVISEKNNKEDLSTSNLIILNDFNAHTEEEVLQLLKNKRNSEFIAIEEKPSGSVCYHLHQLQCFDLSGVAKKFQIFKIKAVGDEIELHLEYDYYEIGEPKRENFKLCNLEINVPIEIKINGKLDHSLSSRKERLFKEHVYIFHVIGKTKLIEIEKMPFSPIKKKIPQPHKTIDLLKELY